MKKIGQQPSKNGGHRAFTLVEMLIVIFIIGMVAGLIFPVVKSVKRWQYVNTARAEMNQIQTALENYKAQYGAYPPNPANNLLSPPLYAELCGQGGAGIINSGSTTTTEDQTAAKNFLAGISSKQIATVGGTTILVTSVRGPDANYQPLGQANVNPFRYRYPGTYNPTGYDLWVQLSINGQLNLICNWSRQTQVNTADP